MRNVCSIPKPICRKSAVSCAGDHRPGDEIGYPAGARSGIVQKDAAETVSMLLSRTAVMKNANAYRARSLRGRTSVTAQSPGGKVNLELVVDNVTVRKLVTIKLMVRATVVVLLALTGGIAAAGATAQLPKDQDAIIFIRHALAPGTGDPVEFDVDNCSTQRNLSEQGRRQAKDIGARLRGLGVTGVPVYTSEWCRCAETAELMAAGSVKRLPLLNSFFASPSDGPAQLQKLKQWLPAIDGPVVLVTHQVVITGMTGVYPSSGEMVVTVLDSDGELSVVSTIETEYR